MTAANGTAPKTPPVRLWLIQPTNQKSKQMETNDKLRKYD